MTLHRLCLCIPTVLLLAFSGANPHYVPGYSADDLLWSTIIRTDLLSITKKKVDNARLTYSRTDP